MFFIQEGFSQLARYYVMPILFEDAISSPFDGVRANGEGGTLSPFVVSP